MLEIWIFAKELLYSICQITIYVRVAAHVDCEVQGRVRMRK